MSFYIFNSKHKKLFYASLGLALLIFSAACCAVGIYIKSSSSKNKYYGSIAASKARHMAINLGKLKHSVIFIGSSRTLYHVDTAYLSNHLQRKSYNYGLDSHHLSNFPFMINQAIKYKPDIIALNIDPDELFYPPKQTKDLSLLDLVIYLKTHQSFRFLAEAFVNYMTNFNLIRAYSVGISNVITSKYNKVTAKKYDTPASKMFTDVYGLCKPFMVKKGKDFDVVLCENGDALLLGGEKSILPSNKIKRLSGLNKQSVALIKHLVSLIEENHISVVLIFSPYYSMDYMYDLSEIKRALPGVKIIDLTHCSIPENGWADINHLNYAGREIYTKILSQYFRKFLQG